MMFPNPPVARISVINFLGSVCFTLGSYAAFLEVINLNLDVALDWDVAIIKEKIGTVHHSVPKLIKVKWFDWQPHRLEYNSTLIQFIGACLFNINCFFGQEPIICCQEWGTNFSFLWGSILFLGGSYLMIPEMLQK